MRDYTAALAWLLSNRSARESYRDDPRSFARELQPEVRNVIAGLDLAALERQARTLVGKRLHEVTLLLPSTRSGAGAQFETLFHEYAETFWPKSHLRHLEDAVTYAHWLRAKAIDVDSAELRMCEFLLGKRWILLSLEQRNGKPPSLLMQYRWRRKIRTVSLWVGP